MEFKRRFSEIDQFATPEGGAFLQHNVAFTDGNKVKGNGRAQRAHGPRDPLQTRRSMVSPVITQDILF